MEKIILWVLNDLPNEKAMFWAFSNRKPRKLLSILLPSVRRDRYGGQEIQHSISRRMFPVNKLCPTNQQLSDFVLGKGNITSVATHIENCNECKSRLTVLPTGDDLFITLIRKVCQDSSLDAMDKNHRPSGLTPTTSNKP